MRTARSNAPPRIRVRTAAAASSGDAGARYCVVVADLIVMKKRGEELDPLFSFSVARALGAARETVFLGLLAEAPRFGIALDAAALDQLNTRDDLKLIDLRTIAMQGILPPEHLPPLAEAKAVLGWHAHHRFCPNCGVPTRPVQGGWQRDCPRSQAEHFPRTDPVVIMLAIAGERCVLGRSPRFPKTMWSALAGFAEPGESIEEAVRREVREEVGLDCARVSYFASQPWPFPSSLMIGCHAEALSGQSISITVEIEEALVRPRGAQTDAEPPAPGGPGGAAADRHSAPHRSRLRRKRPEHFLRIVAASARGNGIIRRRRAARARRRRARRSNRRAPRARSGCRHSRRRYGARSAAAAE